MTRVGVNFIDETGYNGFPGVYANGCCVFDDSGEAVFFEKFSIEFLDKFVKYMCVNKMQNDTFFETINRSLILDEPSIHVNKNVQMKTMHKPELSTLEEVYRSDIISIRYITNGIDIPDLKGGKDYVCVVYGNIVTMNPPGDGENDIPCFELCETSFAVGNARDEVKQKAKWVLDINYDQGAFEKAVKLLVDSE
ncbi:hypothetical protein MACJ_000861 [Theileria orientalis]|uniref:Uncharacterized protein n=1 Tax=Theileria orientalis TaxID=68886 RepID=A0A976M4U1_THEOR|nr:hypothetical protein MACJ_000861 [Theileria orientalis]